MYFSDSNSLGTVIGYICIGINNYIYMPPNYSKELDLASHKPTSSQGSLTAQHNECAAYEMNHGMLDISIASSYG